MRNANGTLSRHVNRLCLLFSPLDENCFYTSGVFVVNLGPYFNVGGMYEFDP
jgi:hypothetical protein